MGLEQMRGGMYRERERENKEIERVREREGVSCGNYRKYRQPISLSLQHSGKKHS